jgi:hypothetical protein
MYPLTRDKYESVLAELREKNASKSTDVE